MKIRTNFVTNSSSSNFLLGVKQELTWDLLMSIMGVTKTSPFYRTASELSAQIMYDAERIDEVTMLRYSSNDAGDNLENRFISSVGGSLLRLFSRVYLISIDYPHSEYLKNFNVTQFSENLLGSNQVTSDIFIISEVDWHRAGAPDCLGKVLDFFVGE